METTKINIKPLSVNQCWQGRRFKTPAYKGYEKELLLKLKPLNMPEKPYEVYYNFGISNLSDFDNIIKPFQDILQKRYLFNDKDIMKAVIEKNIVKKGCEFVTFKIETLK
jgi:hypothetical protein